MFSIFIKNKYHLSLIVDFVNPFKKIPFKNDSKGKWWL